MKEKHNGCVPSIKRNQQSANGSLGSQESGTDDTTYRLPAHTIYRVPTKAYYRKHRLDLNKTWNDLYGKARCSVCKRKMKEKDAYTVVISWEGTEKTNPVHRYKHVKCEVKHGKSAKKGVLL